MSAKEKVAHELVEAFGHAKILRSIPNSIAIARTMGGGGGSETTGSSVCGAGGNSSVASPVG